MKIVKFSSPHWNDFGYDNLGLLGQTPKNNGVWGNYKFEINNNCNTCDFWIIYGSAHTQEKVSVPKGNTIFITSEEVEQHFYLPKFLKQYDKIITSRNDIIGFNTIKSYYINAWFVKKTYDQLISESVIKSKNLSIIVSNLTHLPGHKQRFAFVNKLAGHFKDKMDVFGRGFNFVEDKWDALAPYKYSIAIENAQIPNYFTEKIVDCYLSETKPIYCGCPNIHDFFSDESLLQIDLTDFQKSVKQIEEIIESDDYENSYDKLKSSKNKILNELQFFPYITKILDGLSISNNYSKKTIYPESFFVDEFNFKNSVYQSIIYGKQFLKNKLF